MSLNRLTCYPAQITELRSCEAGYVRAQAETNEVGLSQVEAVVVDQTFEQHG